MVRHCSGLLAFKTYPHVDQHEIGLAACHMLQTAMQRGAMPSAHVWRLPTLVGCDFGGSDGIVMPELLSMARDTRNSDPRCLALEICAGFSWSEVPFAGPLVVVIWTEAERLRDELVAPLLKAIWKTRDVTSVEYATPDEAVTLVAGWNEDRLPPRT
jgi:microcystin degradation protein MlrC